MGYIIRLKAILQKHGERFVVESGIRLEQVAHLTGFCTPPRHVKAISLSPVPIQQSLELHMAGIGLAFSARVSFGSWRFMEVTPI